LKSRALIADDLEVVGMAVASSTEEDDGYSSIGPQAEPADGRVSVTRTPTPD
jgi:hypothetical protein